MTPAAILRSLRKTFRTLTVCAAVPAAVFSGQPAYGCICTDGHYELFCQARHRASEHEHDSAGCTCCDSSAKQQGDHACCKGKTTCCRTTEQQVKNQTHSTSPRVRSNGCCTPVVREATASTVLVFARTVDDHHVPAAWTVCSEQERLPFEACHAAHVQFDTGPPPDDLVVTLARLII